MADQLFAEQVAMANAAAGSGIGSAIVDAVLARGACVMAADVSAQRIARLEDRSTARPCQRRSDTRGVLSARR